MINMEQMNKENVKKSPSYKFGQFIGAAFTTVLSGCVLAILIALTYQLIKWIV